MKKLHFWIFASCLTLSPFLKASLMHAEPLDKATAPLHTASKSDYKLSALP